MTGQTDGDDALGESTDGDDASAATPVADRRAAVRSAGEARADAALRAIAGGADPAQEAFLLANRFSDEHSERLGTALRRWMRRGRDAR